MARLDVCLQRRDSLCTLGMAQKEDQGTLPLSGPACQDQKSASEVPPATIPILTVLGADKLRLRNCSPAGV